MAARSGRLESSHPCPPCLVSSCSRSPCSASVASGAATYVHYNLIQNPDYSQLLRHQRDGVVQGGVSQPLWLGRRRAGRASAGSSFSPGAAADVGLARQEPDHGQRAGVHLRGLDAGARRRPLPRVRVVLHPEGSLPAVRRDVRRGHRRVRDLRGRQRPCRCRRCPGAPCATCACWSRTPLAIVIALLFVGGAAWGVERLSRARTARPVVAAQLPLRDRAQRAELEQLVGRAAGDGELPVSPTTARRC